MTNQTSSNTLDQTNILLDEILMAPSQELISDRFNPANATAAPCGTSCGKGCGGGCGGSA